jgi:hypothetical protein
VTRKFGSGNSVDRNICQRRDTTLSTERETKTFQYNDIELLDEEAGGGVQI